MISAIIRVLTRPLVDRNGQTVPAGTQVILASEKEDTNVYSTNGKQIEVHKGSGAERSLAPEGSED